MSAGETSGSDTGSIEALRHVREVEEAVAGRLAAVKGEGEARLKRIAEETGRAIAEARTQAEASKAQTIAAARTRAEGEAAAILAEGRKAAQSIELKATQTVAAKRAQVLDIVLGDLRTED